MCDQAKVVDATGAGYIEIHKTDYAEAAVREAFYRAVQKAVDDEAVGTRGSGAAR